VRKDILFMVCLLVIVSALSCKKQSPPQPQAQTEKQPPVPAAAASPWKMDLKFTPDPPISDKPTVFHLTVIDESGKPVSSAQGNASLVMTEMDMGKNEFSLADKGAGEYEGTGTFTMSGPWNVVVSMTAAGKTGQQTFPVVVHRE
jgi:hypothetical protein